MLQSGPIRVVGTMSGTSLDGVDVAEIVTDGVRVLEFGRSAFRPYTADEQAVLRAALGQWSGAAVDRAAQLVEQAHIEALSDFADADLIGFHGQTLAHDPAGGRTLQVGDGAVLARALTRPVAWDFRSNDMVQGGQGAPLAPFYHFALAAHMRADAPLAFLNLGGVGNITWVDPRQGEPDAPGALLAFDTGPANAPLNDLMQARFAVGLDRGGDLAAQGVANPAIVQAFLQHPYFAHVPPKSLDRDDFADLLPQVADLPDADAAATLVACAVQAVLASLDHCPVRPATLWVTGGGRHNRAMMEGLGRAGIAVHPVERAGLNGDMLEAQAFAFLAVRTAHGLPISAPGTTGVRQPVSGGRVSRG